MTCLSLSYLFMFLLGSLCFNFLSFISIAMVGGGHDEDFA